ncbi:hypothetical protein M0Q50_08955 [bacterium]|jgi:hypothetical protein|nr:hypothetical protein [bacterium]
MNIPKYYIGQEINTIYGKGIIVKLDMPFNGLYIEPERTTVTVWFGTENAGNDGISGSRWVSRAFDIDDVDIRKKKLDSL